MRVLGIDPGLTRCGAAVVERGAGGSVRSLFLGVITTPAEDALEHRLLALDAGINELLDRFDPNVVAIERVFSQHNVRSAMGTAQAGAVAMIAAARRGIAVASHTPTEVKAAVTGSGRSQKAQVTAMVTRILALPAPPSPADAADAAAIAVCHAWRGTAQNRLAAAVAAHRGST